MRVDGQLIRAGAERVAALPTTELFEGREVLLVTDNEKYHYVEGEWKRIGDVADLALPPADEAGQFFTSSNAGSGNYAWTSNLINETDNVRVNSTLNGLYLRSEFSGFDDNIFLTNQDYPTDQGFHNIVLGAHDQQWVITEDFDRNVMIGRNNIENQLTTADSVFIGYDCNPRALYEQSVLIGMQAGKWGVANSNNVVGVGYQAMQVNTSQTQGISNSIGIGAQAGFGVDGADNVFIGYRAGIGLGPTNNRLIIGNQNAPQFIDGDMNGDTLTINADTFVQGNLVATNGSVPDGGAANQVLAKVTAADYDYAWSTLQGLVPAGGDTDQVLTKVTGTDYDYVWADAGGGGTTKFQEKRKNTIPIGDLVGQLTILETFNSLVPGNWYKITWTMELAIQMANAGSFAAYVINLFNGSQQITNRVTKFHNIDVGTNQTFVSTEGYETSFQCASGQTILDIEFEVGISNTGATYTGYNLFATIEEFDPTVRIPTTDFT